LNGAAGKCVCAAMEPWWRKSRKPDPALPGHLILMGKRIFPLKVKACFLPKLRQIKSRILQRRLIRLAFAGAVTTDPACGRARSLLAAARFRKGQRWPRSCRIEGYTGRFGRGSAERGSGDGSWGIEFPGPMPVRRIAGVARSANRKN